MASNTKKSMLIVDDCDESRSILTEVLSSLGFKCEIAKNGIEALSKFNNKKYDFILSDSDMPLMNGMSLLKEIRSVDESTVFILMSGRDRQNEVDSINKGKNIFLSKPFNELDINYLISLAE